MIAPLLRDGRHHTRHGVIVIQPLPCCNGNTPVSNAAEIHCPIRLIPYKAMIYILAQDLLGLCP
jgi:hypothetical protein